jgi:SH3-like domain-containing protein
MTCYRSMIVALVLLGVLCVPLHVNADETMSVQVKESEIRATPSFLGRIVARLVYGDRVTVTGKKDSWTKVSLKGGAPQGWMHASALTTKRIVLKAGQTNVQSGTSQDELALAGKGFNDQVEASFMNQNKTLDYTWINVMEKYKVAPELMSTFLAQGEVGAPSEGGAQ